MIKKGLRNFLIISTGVLLVAYMMSSCKDKKHECNVGEENWKGDTLFVCATNGKWDNGTVIKKDPPIVEKKDTVISWNFNNSFVNQGGRPGFPTEFQLKEIKKMPGINNVYLELDAMDQAGSNPKAVARCSDSLRIWVRNGLVTIKLKNREGKKDTIVLDQMPVQEAIDTWSDLGYLLMLADDYSATKLNAFTEQDQKRQEHINRRNTAIYQRKQQFKK